MQLQNKTFCIVTLGCRVNLFESNWIAGRLKSQGAIEVPDISEADICILNTCTVTNKADAKTKNFLNRILRSKSKKLSVIMGCFSQTNANYFLKKNFDIVIGTKDKNKIIEFIENYEKPFVSIDNLEQEDNFDVFSFEASSNKTRGYIKIQDGCNYKCNYCIIPLARGKQRSLDKKIIFDYIKDSIKADIKEIILTGVNTAGYGEKSEYNFTKLIGDIDKIPGDFRVRISSLEPFQISNELVNIITSNPKRWCQHLHICLQSADDKILRDMNRKYSIEKFIKLIQQIRRLSPLVSITTDYIVGFPTETADSWSISLQNLAKIDFADMHIFPYSDRQNTRSSKIAKMSAEFEKKARFLQLQSINNLVQKKYLQKFLGQTVNVLFEKSKDPLIQHGHSEYFFEVFVSTKQSLENKLLPIKIIEIRNNKVIGEL